MKGHGLARGSNAGKQGSGIWFAVEGGKPWRSATCISARPDQEVMATVLSPNIKKCGCPAGHCQCSGVEGTRVATGHLRFMAQKKSESPQRGDCNESTFFCPSPSLDGSCYPHAPVSRPIGDWADQCTWQLVRHSPSHGVSRGHTFRQFAPLPLFVVTLAALERLGFACLVFASVLDMPLRPCVGRYPKVKIYRQITGLCAILSIAFLDGECGKRAKTIGTKAQCTHNCSFHAVKACRLAEETGRPSNRR